MAANIIEVAPAESDKVYDVFVAEKWYPVNPAGSCDFKAEDFHLVPALEENEEPFPIVKLDARAKKLLVNHGFAVAKRFFKEQDELLQKVPRLFTTIVFSDAAFDTPQGRRVTCLFWSDVHMSWVMVFRIVDDPKGHVTTFDFFPRFN